VTTEVRDPADLCERTEGTEPLCSFWVRRDADALEIADWLGERTERVASSPSSWIQADVETIGDFAGERDTLRETRDSEAFTSPFQLLFEPALEASRDFLRREEDFAGERDSLRDTRGSKTSTSCFQLSFGPALEASRDLLRLDEPQADCRLTPSLQVFVERALDRPADVVLFRGLTAA
jgi:hypothetical protein